MEHATPPSPTSSKTEPCDPESRIAKGPRLSILSWNCNFLSSETLLLWWWLLLVFPYGVLTFAVHPVRLPSGSRLPPPAASSPTQLTPTHLLYTHSLAFPQLRSLALSFLHCVLQFRISRPRGRRWLTGLQTLAFAICLPY